MNIPTPKSTKSMDDNKGRKVNKAKAGMVKQWEWVSGPVRSLPNIAPGCWNWRGCRQEAVAHRITLLYGSCVEDVSLSQTRYLGAVWVAFSPSCIKFLSL